MHGQKSGPHPTTGMFSAPFFSRGGKASTTTLELAIRKVVLRKLAALCKARGVALTSGDVTMYGQSPLTGSGQRRMIIYGSGTFPHREHLKVCARRPDHTWVRPRVRGSKSAVRLSPDDRPPFGGAFDGCRKVRLAGAAVGCIHGDPNRASRVAGKSLLEIAAVATGMAVMRVAAGVFEPTIPRAWEGPCDCITRGTCVCGSGAG